MSRIMSSCLYFTSFFPLWLSILFIDVMSCCENSNNIWTERISISIILIVSFISFIILLFVFSKKSKEGCAKVMIKDVTEDKTITSEYLLSYILPLFAFDFTRWDQVVLFLIFFLILGFLCIRHNYFSVNVWLEFLNYKMYTCNLENEDGIVIRKKIISHRILSVHKGEDIYLKSLNNEIKLDIER